MKKHRFIILLVIASIVSLNSCTTSAVTPYSASAFNLLKMNKPVRPQLATIDSEQDYKPMIENTIKLMSYTKQLEEYSLGLERYYDELYNI